MSTPEVLTDEVLEMAAFAAEPGGGNFAGVVLDASAWTDAQMQETATRLGHPESAFVVEPPGEDRQLTIRYFSPLSEVPFCGHATIAAAAVLAGRLGTGPLHFNTKSGPVDIETSERDGVIQASFTSVEPRVSDLDPKVLDQLLDVLGLTREDLREDLPPRLAYAGATHPIVPLAERATFDGFSFEPAAMRALQDQHGWVTVAVLWQASEAEWEARNPFPVGTVAEDPATGAAAAATGAYLRSQGAVPVPGAITIKQGKHVGRPSILAVSIPASGGITVSGSATPLLSPVE
ncbi:PhzF family phenazine biosynthesis protein [Luteipulveratus mongoliensis]|uniref:Phenazine biosynthesis protein PhzF n=1 Tax=Luteipulveratus mongoliensis TaxID=571913 RepID=A0A0K1JD71_9MICO|nr:PhzF family phenazine biosynthesis isomerase [Luteipulveratus mongoliensis]AKU14651.1 hypothetical protein VV02_00160 [Luteipulveratus mongoliensis]